MPSLVHYDSRRVSSNVVVVIVTMHGDQYFVDARQYDFGFADGHGGSKNCARRSSPIIPALRSIMYDHGDGRDVSRIPGGFQDAIEPSLSVGRMAKQVRIHDPSVLR